MRWFRRNAKVILAGAVVGWAAWSYLLPGLLAGPVAAHLAAAYGAPVRVDAVHLGWGGTSLRGLKLYEAGAAPGDAPWAEAAEVRTDVTPWAALAGHASPRDVVLEDAAVFLRFDRDGGLLTRLPGRGGGGGGDLPALRLRRGRLTVRQDGRPNDFVVRGVTADVRSDGGRLVLKGEVADPTWGTWSLCGERDETSGELRTTVATDRVSVTPARLSDLPLIPLTVWEQVRGEGEMGVECVVRARPGSPGSSLRVTLTPRLMAVALPTLGLTADRVLGVVVYEDGVVRLRGVEGDLADGRLGVDGELDFHAPGTDADIRLAVDATGVDVRRLPAAWNLPDRLAGRLCGRADVRVTLAGGRTAVAGTGQGWLRGLPLGGRSATVSLALRDEAPSGSATPAACCLVAELDEGDADLGRLATELGVEPPVPVAGRLALRVRLVVPLDTPDDPQTFQARATAELPRVTCGGVVLDGVKVRVGYDGGVLRLDECGGTVPRPAAARPPPHGRAMLEVVRAGVTRAGGIAGPNEFRAVAHGDFRQTAGAGAFRLEGAADLRRPTRGGTVLEEVRARTAFSGGALRRDVFCGTVRSPLPAAAVGPGLVLPQAVFARLTLDGIPLSLLAPPDAGEGPAVDGTLSAAVDGWAPVARLGGACDWNGRGAVTAQSTRVGGRAVRGDARADLKLGRGVLSVTAVAGHLDGAAVTGRGDVEVGGPWRLRASLGLTADLAALRRPNSASPSGPAVAGRVAATALVTGSLSPVHVEGEGDGAVIGLVVGDVPPTALRFRWHADADRLAVRVDVRAEAFGDHMSGEGNIPLSAAKLAPPEMHARRDGRPALAAAIPRDTVRTPGRANGQAGIVLAAAGSRADSPFTAMVGIQTPAATVDGAVEYRAGTLAYRADGAALGGRFHLDGRVTPTDAGTADRPPDGRLRVDGLDLWRLCEFLGVQAAAGPFGGTADAEVRFRHHGPDRRPVGIGTVAVRRVLWGEAELAPEVKATVRLTPVGLELADVTGAVCGGEFRGEAALDWGGTAGRVDLDLTGAEASRVLAPWPALAEQVRGPLAAHVRVTPGAEWEAVGRITLRRGRVAGVEVPEVELPVEAGYSPALGRGRLDVREATAQVALGRAVGRASCRWGAGTRVEGVVRFTGLDLRHLLPPPASEEDVVAGLLSGRVELRGTDVRSLDDVAGSLDCTLRKTTVLAFPVLRDLVPFVEPAGSGRTVFDTGECRARLDRGVVRVERLALVGPAVRLAVDGTVGPDDRLGLNAEIHTGRLGASPDAPVAVRLVRLRVNGTVPRPLIRVTQ